MSGWELIAAWYTCGHPVWKSYDISWFRRTFEGDPIHQVYLPDWLLHAVYDSDGLNDYSVHEQAEC